VFKKLTMFGVGVAALAALVVPSAAGAAELTQEAGHQAPVPTGTPVTFTQNPSLHLVTKSTTLGKIECGSIETSGVVTKSTFSNFTAELTKGSGGPCTVNGKTGAEILRWSGMVTSPVSGEGTSDLEFEIHVPNVGNCTFFTASVEPAPSAFTSGSNTMKLTEGNLESSPELCGEGTISGGLKLGGALLFEPTESGGTQLTQLTHLVPVGSQVTLAQDPSLPIIMKSGWLGKWYCGSIVASGALMQNSEGIVRVAWNTGSGGPCTINGKEGMKMINTVGSVILQGSHEGHASYEFWMSIPNIGTCGFYTPPVPGQSVEFEQGTNRISLNTYGLKASPEACGEITLSGGLVLKAPDGSPLTVQ